MSEDEVDKIIEKKRKPSPIDITKDAIVVDQKTITRLKRSDPQFYGTLEQIAEEEGKTVEDIIRESVIHSVRMKKAVMSEMTVDELYTAWLILREMMDFSRELFFKYARLILSDETSQILEMRKEVMEQYKTEMKPIEEIKPPPSEKIEIKNRMTKLMINMIEGLMEDTMNRMMGKKVTLNVPVEYVEK
jgi:hypothetical protein